MKRTIVKSHLRNGHRVRKHYRKIKKGMPLRTYEKEGTRYMQFIPAQELIPATTVDRRLSQSAAANRKAERETIAFQKKLLKLKGEQDLAVKRMMKKVKKRTEYLDPLMKRLGANQ